MKKICFLIGYYPILKGGSEYQAYLLSHAIKEEYKIFFISCEHDSENTFMDNGIIIHTLKPRFPRFHNFHFLYKRDLLRILREEQPDIIYERYMSSILGIASYYCKTNPCKLVWHVSTEKILHPPRLAISRRMLLQYIENMWTKYGIRNSDLAICQANYQSVLLKENWNKSNSLVVRNFQPKETSKITKSNPIKILWIANYKTIKRPELFIQLAQRFENYSNLEFIMVGRPPEGSIANMVNDEISKLKNLKVLGEMSIEQVNSLLVKSNVLVCTSEFEGFPNTFIQAWLREVPVISLSVDPDNILEREGIGFHSKTFEQMCSDLCFMIDNDQQRQDMGKKARLFAEKNFDLDENTKKMAEIFRALAP